jgi:hypothetical protein
VEFRNTRGYELAPFTYETPIKKGQKNAFSPYPKCVLKKVTYETPIKFSRAALKVSNVRLKIC